MASVLIPLAVVLLFVAAFILFRTAIYTSSEPDYQPAPLVEVDSLTIAEHLGRIVRCETVSVADPEHGDWRNFKGLKQELASIYPRLHRTFLVETVNKHSLLYTWPGSNPELDPLLFAAHMDVAPVEPGSEAAWEHPPFSGEIADGFIWGRGVLDDKCSVTGLMEAVETLIQQGFHPERTLYLALGHDEELTGIHGAGEIARLLAERGVRLEAVFDEGGFLVSGILDGVTRPVAMVGIAEKAYLSIELRVTSSGGHSSAPQTPTAIGRLSRAIQRLEAHPMPARLDYLAWQMDYLASELPFAMRILMANRWMFGGLIRRSAAAKPTTNAMIRTTTAPTIIHGGMQENVLPSEAHAVVNFRLLPGDSIPRVIEHVTHAIADKEVHLRVLTLPGDLAQDAEAPDAPSATVAISDTGGPVFPLLAEAIRQVFPEAVVSPYLVFGATDSRYYTRLCSQVFRFLPVRIAADDLQRVHGANERLALKNCGDMVQFYHRLIATLAGKG
ncbi:MAG TPA: M20 family peptidase [Anaerolineaceae bacterium]